MSKHINMTQGKPLKLLVSFAIPLMFGNIFQQLYTVVDTAIVGRGVGLDALAALGSVDWLNWLVLGLAFGFTQGFSVRISQKFGEGDMEGLKQIAGQSAFLSAAISVVSTLLVQLALPLILTLLNVRDDLRGTATLYTRILLGGMTASVFYNYCASVQRAIGDSRTPLVAMVVASVVNIALDCVAVFLLGWGVAGAAAAVHNSAKWVASKYGEAARNSPAAHTAKKACPPSAAELRCLDSITNNLYYEKRDFEKIGGGCRFVCGLYFGICGAGARA